MKDFRFLYLIVLNVILALGSCSKTESYAANISDLNGVWQPDWSYKATLEIPEAESHIRYRRFSWGESEYIPDTTFNVDLMDKEPFIQIPGTGLFPVTEIEQTGINSIKIHAYRGPIGDPYNAWPVDVIFHFIDKDTVWIDNTDSHGKMYGKKAPWHRLSGPGR